MIIILDGKKIDLRGLTRRGFLKIGGAGVLGMAATEFFPPTPAAAAQSAQNQTYPVADIAPLSSIEPGAQLAFDYPDENSPALLIRLPEPGLEGIGPDNSIVAYSILCTHKGCPVDYNPDRKLMICPCHWSTFDPAKAGNLVIGQASQALPQVTLQIKGDMIQAVGMTGLIYGRHTNIV